MDSKKGIYSTFSISKKSEAKSLNIADFKYVGFKTKLDGKTSILDVSEKPLSWKTEEEAYCSVFAFTEQIKDLPSLKDLGPEILCYPYYIPFDFDSKDLNKAFESVKELKSRFDQLKIDTHVFFSGNKGFHLLIQSQHFGILPLKNNFLIKTLAEKIAGDLPGFDPSIYNKTRIFRCPNSLNIAGKKHKITIDIYWSLEEILGAAETGSSVCEYDPLIRFSGIVPNEHLASLWDSILNPQETQKPVAREHEPQTHGSIFIRAEEGKRNETAFSVARKLARRGIPYADGAHIMANVWNGSYCVPSLPSDELDKVVKNAYLKGSNEFVEEGSYSGRITDIHQEFVLIAKELEAQKDRFMTGYKMLDEYTMGFAPQDTITIAGRSGNFKSAILTNILQRGSKIAQRPALYFSMEMGRQTLIPRIIQQSEQISKKEALTLLREGKRLHDFPAVNADFSHLKFIYLSNLSTEQMVGLIEHHIESVGNPCAIGIDYLGLFRGCNNNTERTAKQAQEIKTVIAKVSNCPVFTLAQAKALYEGREGDIELDRGCVKDSDAVLDLADYSIGLWGHWQYIEELQREEKFIFGRFYKSRGFDDDLYQANPYMGFNLDKKHMRLNDIVHIPYGQKPSFKQRTGNNDE